VPRCLHLCSTNISVKAHIHNIHFCASQVHVFYKIHKPTINSLALLGYCNAVISRNVQSSVKFISCHRYSSAGRYDVLKATRCRNAQHRHVQFCSKVISGLSHLCDLVVRKCARVMLRIYHYSIVLVIPAFRISQLSSHCIRQ
jgi:hypothetical protein